jgi:hypothetical protein
MNFYHGASYRSYLKKNYQMYSYYIQNTTFYKPKFLKTDLLRIGLSISYIL